MNPLRWFSIHEPAKLSWSVRPLGTRNCVREAEITEESRQIVRMELDIELFVDEVLNLLFLPGFALFEQVQEMLSLSVVETGRLNVYDSRTASTRLRVKHLFQ